MYVLQIENANLIPLDTITATVLTREDLFALATLLNIANQRFSVDCAGVVMPADLGWSEAWFPNWCAAAR